jgi:hypothetical protein
MKKILVVAAILVAGMAANAAAFSWSAVRVYGPSGSLLSDASAQLYCDALSSSALSTVDVVSGAIAETTFNVAATAGNSYDFYFKITTTSGGNEVTFTSANVQAAAMDVGTSAIAFGNQKSATQASGAWAAVPEPTSGLLMLLGVAGLALRRRRV